MNYIQDQKTFFIEGGDNVGKTTTIKRIEEILSKNDSIGELLNNTYECTKFYKFPSKDMTEFMNTYTKLLSIVDNQLFNLDSTNTQLIEAAMHYLIEDMEYVITNSYSSRINICDRGILSTYLYQFLNYAKLKYDIDNTNALNESILLKIFIKEILNKTIPFEHRFYTETSIIILYNNTTNKLDIDESETIEYKKKFDCDQSLQDTINRSLNNIVSNITESETIKLKPYKLYDITFYRVNIYKYIKEEGTTRYKPVRKSVDELANEIIDIILSSIHLYKEDKNEK